ncbi:MAG: radical SAM protein [Candidatus Aenigmarchaeota archaeon]|nr:radical SAM protein [Candidatus Aenigmarchaeota archaeon]
MMGVCKICKKESEVISSFLGLCRECILKEKKALEIAKKAHEISRKKFGLTPFVPKDEKGLKCFGCGNECKIPEGSKGYCGLVENRNGKLIRNAGTAEKGLLEWYYDPLPTNCVSINFCSGGTGIGFPKYAKCKNGEVGYFNLAVFYGSCNFNCLFCQNWHFKYLTQELKPVISAKELASKVNEKVTCICFFGGTPEPQLIHVIETSKLALEKKKNDILRICLESNGNANWKLLKKFAKISFESGGNIKFDLKFPPNSSLNFALCGISNEKTYENFKKLAKFHKKRDFPFLTASTLLIPGYVTEKEVREIARFIASLDKTIPYSLLGFYPHFEMKDLPLTSRKLAENCLKVAKEEGLEKVRIGNEHLLV